MFGATSVRRATSLVASSRYAMYRCTIQPRLVHEQVRQLSMGRNKRRVVKRSTKKSNEAMSEMKQYQEEARKRRDQRQAQSQNEQKEEQDQQKPHEQEEQEQHEQPKKSSNQKKDGFDFDPNKMKKIEIDITSRQILIGLLAALGGYYMIAGGGDYFNREITWQEFKRDYLDRGLVTKLVVVNNRLVRVHTNYASSEGVYFTIGSVDAFERHMNEAQQAAGYTTKNRVPVAYESEGKYARIFMGYIPTVLTFAAIIWILRKAAPGGAGGAGGPGGIFSFGKNQAKLFNKMTDVKVKFDEVAGMDEAKEEIMEFVKFLKDPKKYEELGARIPRGAILSGSPGTGKTLLAKATAGESGVPFYSISASEFIEMYAGVGASRVRSLFKEAREHAPSIIFLDEIDAIGKTRGKTPMGGGGTDEREGTLNQLLVEMDGFDSSDHVVVLAGTNRPDVLDPALLRPGRFDRRIAIDRPDLEGRKSIYNVHLSKIVLDKSIKDIAGKLAAMTPGFAGADIANVCNEAALTAARMGDDCIKMIHFEKAIDRVIAGLERKTRVLTPEKKRVVAYHEAGHAICGWFLEHADPLVKVSIIPRGSAALGYAQYVPPEHYLFSEHQFMDRITMALGGRVSEEIHFDSVTLGASDDFKKVTQMAKSMVTKYGMSNRVGTVYFDREPMAPHDPFSQDTGRLIDSEVRRIVNEGHERCAKLLKEKQHEVELVAEELLKKEVISREDLLRLLGPRPWGEKSAAFDKYLAPEAENPSEPSPSPSNL